MQSWTFKFLAEPFKIHVNTTAERLHKKRIKNAVEINDFLHEYKCRKISKNAGNAVKISLEYNCMKNAF
jgi:hypothetical protein